MLAVAPEKRSDLLKQMQVDLSEVDLHSLTPYIMVHPGLLWVEIESSAVEIDGCFEVIGVSVATDSSFDGHDFAVDAFGDGVCDSVSAIAHHVR